MEDKTDGLPQGNSPASHSPQSRLNELQSCPPPYCAPDPPETPISEGVETHVPTPYDCLSPQQRSPHLFRRTVKVVRSQSELSRLIEEHDRHNGTSSRGAQTATRSELERPASAERQMPIIVVEEPLVLSSSAPPELPRDLPRKRTVVGDTPQCPQMIALEGYMCTYVGMLGGWKLQFMQLSGDHRLRVLKDKVYLVYVNQPFPRLLVPQPGQSVHYCLTHSGT